MWVAVLFGWLGIFTVVSYLPRLPHGDFHLSISAATTILLASIWQVQAASVGLVFALAVFVFGLLQGRGRLAYREFLRRTGALPLATFNVASLLFNGLVLLGLGHQAPAYGEHRGPRLGRHRGECHRPGFDGDDRGHPGRHAACHRSRDRG